MTDVIDYDFLVAQFEQSLFTTLRSHRPAEDYLEMWVPDEDPVKGLLNMIEAAQIAGRDAISIKISRATLPDDRQQELQEQAADIAPTRVSSRGDEVVIDVQNMQGGADFDAVAEPFRGTLRAAYGSLRHEGDPGAAPTGQLRVEAEEGAVRLTVLADPASHRILDARHGGGASAVDRAVLDRLCAVLVGLPMQEAADHAGHKLVEALRPADTPRPVAGIMLPQNADPVFSLPVRLVRRLRAAYGEATGHTATRNFFETAPAEQWANLSAEGKRDRVNTALAIFAGREGVAPADIVLHAIEPNLLKDDVRVVVALGEGIGYERQAPLARSLELFLKRQIEPKLELYMSEVKDTNAIRRL